MLADSGDRQQMKFKSEIQVCRKRRRSSQTLWLQANKTHEKEKESSKCDSRWTSSGWVRYNINNVRRWIIFEMTFGFDLMILRSHACWSHPAGLRDIIYSLVDEPNYQTLVSAQTSQRVVQLNVQHGFYFSHIPLSCVVCSKNSFSLISSPLAWIIRRGC